MARGKRTFWYGLCSKGVEGITAQKTRLVIIKGHDCITCFLAQGHATGNTSMRIPAPIGTRLAGAKNRKSLVNDKP